MNNCNKCGIHISEHRTIKFHEQDFCTLCAFTELRLDILKTVKEIKENGGVYVGK